VPRVIVAEAAGLGLERCRPLPDARNKQTARRTGQAITRHFTLLETSPDIGRPLHELPELRELVSGFGDSDYVAL
jgi:hypothetical protein